MTGNTDSARVCDPLTVAYEQIGPAAQARKRRYRRRALTKAEQARHIRKRGRQGGLCLLQRRERREIEQNGGGMGGTAALTVRDIDAGHCYRRCEAVSPLNVALKP